MFKMRIGLAVGFVALTLTAQSYAVVVDFTGGTVTRLDTTTQTTNNTVVWDDVDYYEEGGFRLDFLPNPGSAGFATHVGDYYSALNDVIHAHWFTGDFGGVVEVNITKIGGGTFDLNGFLLTSNTEFGGTVASGNEAAFVQGWVSNVATGPAVLLPSEDWGFPATPIVLGTDFDVVDKITFTVANAVDCFGMDDFYIDQEFVEEFPEPSSLLICALVGAAGMARRSARRNVA